MNHYLPFENYVGDDPVISYIAIRADEPERSGYISKKTNIKTCFPFKDDGLVKEDILNILESSGLGIPSYYKWRSRSGCYFCFFQRQEEWVGLKQHHPDLFEKAKEYEKIDVVSGKKYTWNQKGNLDEILLREEKQISTDNNRHKKSKKLIDNLVDDENDPDDGCLICTL